ncbi:unannotated protein [freshwater metagenome]|uniref:Unannotated protein n=1 Tax=freshwater metagenome TaxID=449393 RepID=A0A6J6JRN4_9ZZZZ
MHNRNATVVRSCGVSGSVGNDSPTDGDDAIGAGQTPLGKLPTKRLDGGHRFRLFAIAHREHLVFASGIDLDTETFLSHDRNTLRPFGNDS